MSDENPVEIPPRGAFLTEDNYAKLKWVAQIFIPALATFYGTVALATGIPQTDVVLTVVGAFDLLLGTLLGISTRNYNDAVSRIPVKYDGALNIDTVNPDKDVFGIEPYDGLLGLAGNEKTEIVLKVNRSEGEFQVPVVDEGEPLPGND